MEQDNAKLIALVKIRLQKLESLAHEIQASQAACIALDLEALRTHDHQKEHLCAEIRRLDCEISKAIENSSPAGPLRTVLAAGHAKQEQPEPAKARQLNALLEAAEAARAEVSRLNRVYARFLARSLNTLNVMMNVVSYCLGIYPSALRPASVNIPFERSY